MTDAEWKELESRLAGSHFRSRFHLAQKDRDYIRAKGLDTVRRHAEDFIEKRLSPALPLNDGRQTPMKGHPVFIAQHATALCCRACMEKWHRIPRGRRLTEEEKDYAADVIMRWICREMNKETTP